MKQIKKMQNTVTINDWVAMFRDLGLDEARMKQWHKTFEARHPQAHQSFLQWLGLPEGKIEAIRAESKITS
jgi:hypothetical protein